MNQQERQINPNRVAIYIRWSTDDQGEGTTKAEQLDKCQKYCSYKGWNAPRVYIDEGESGGTLKRPQMGQLRKDVRAGEIEQVVVYRIDRLSRNIVDCVDLVLREWVGVCTVSSASEEFDTNTALGKMVFTMLASFADFERSSIRQRTLSGKYNRAREGRNPGYQTPYGYLNQKNDKGEFIRNSVESEVVQRVYRMYLSGMGALRIAQSLNGQVPPPSNGKKSTLKNGQTWNQNTILQILRNPSYTGVLTYGRTTVNPKAGEPKQKARLKGKNPVVTPGAMECVIEKGEFEAAQALLREKGNRSAPRRSYSSEYLLSSLMRCGHCGYAMVGFVSTRKNGRKQFYYYCQGKRMGNGCDARMARCDDAEAHVLARLMQEFSPSNRQAVVDAAIARHSQQVRHANFVLGAAEERVKDLKDRRKALLDSVERREIRGELVSDRVEELSADLVTANDQYEEAQRALEAAEAQLGVINRQTVDELADKLSLWDHVSPEQRKRVLRSLVKVITWYQGPDMERPHMHMEVIGY